MEELRMKKEINAFLSDIGCCWRCAFIFQGESRVESFKNIETFIEFQNDSDSKVISEDSNGVNMIDISNDSSNLRDASSSLSDMKEDVVDDEDDDETASKKLKTLTCLSCLGLLQHCVSPSVVNTLSGAIESEGYDASAFSLGLSLPLCLAIRIHSMWAHLISHFPTIDVDPARKNHIGVLKDVWRNLAGPLVSARVRKDFVSGKASALNLAVTARYDGDQEDCALLERLDPERFRLRRKQHRKYAEGVFTKQAVEDALKGFGDELFLRALPDPPSAPPAPVLYDPIQCNHTSIYLAGRYNKFSRELPQTPWLLEEVRRFESSVQELICDKIQAVIPHDGSKFCAAGREDVDVRCLGGGRPFFVEVLNPRKVELSPSLLRSLQEEVNRGSPLIVVRDLQAVDKSSTHALKEGESDKTKSYCALCFSLEGPVSDEALSRLKGLAPPDLTLSQMTPLRVLHRRTLILRKRIVHVLRAQRVDSHFFKVYLKTQAGTYIKEFVHGDFGRTTPNLGSLLGVKCDVVALDVEEVELDWPPPLT